MSEDTLPKVTEENQHLQQTVTQLSLQLEEVDRQLDQERSTRKSSEEQYEAKIATVEKSWAAVLEEKKDNWEAKERSLEERVDGQDRLLKEMKASYEVSQRLHQTGDTADDDGRNSTSAAELEIITSELERTTLRLAEIEARNEQLRMELVQTSAQRPSPTRSTAIEDDPAYLRMQSENSSLRRQMDAAKLKTASQQREWESRLRTRERELARQREDCENLQQKVKSWGDYEEVKRELSMLKVGFTKSYLSLDCLTVQTQAIEFATGENDELEANLEMSGLDSGGAPSGATLNGSVSGSRANSLEHLLLARNKKLGDELTLLRVSYNELQEHLQTLQGRLSQTTTELDQSRNLSATLENDLLRLQQEASAALPSSGMSLAATHASRYPHMALAGSRRFKTSPTSSIISGFDPMGSAQLSPDPNRAGDGGAGGSAILPMVTAQRDRFKQRNSQLEEELSKTYSIVTSLRQEITALQKDNLSLYEKSRYTSSFHRGPVATTSSSGYRTQPDYGANPSAVQTASGTSSGLSVDRYRSAYEASISPFAAFRAHESARAYRRMKWPERVVFSLTRMVLASRISRNLFAAYCLTLHGLILLQLYWTSMANVERHANRLGESPIHPP